MYVNCGYNKEMTVTPAVFFINYQLSIISFKISTVVPKSVNGIPVLSVE